MLRGGPGGREDRRAPAGLPTRRDRASLASLLLQAVHPRAAHRPRRRPASPHPSRATRASADPSSTAPSSPPRGEEYRGCSTTYKLESRWECARQKRLGRVVRIETGGTYRRVCRRPSARVRPITRCCSRPRRATGSASGTWRSSSPTPLARWNLRAFHAPYEGDGRRNQPFDPQMMVTVLLYAYATRTFSSRRIARKVEEDAGYRVLAAGSFPAHHTIAAFRQQHLAAVEALFVQVVPTARETGVVQLSTLAIDGSKVKAHASKHKAMSCGRMRDEARRLREQRRPRRDSKPGKPTRIGRRGARRTMAARVGGHKPFARNFGVPPDDAQDNFIDPKSRIMKTAHGFDQCYNGQIAVDEPSQIIVATGLTNCPPIKGRSCPDAGYRDDATFAALETRQITANVSLGCERKPGGARGDTAHGRATGERARAGALPTAQGDRRARPRLDQRSPRLSSLQSTRRREGAGRVERYLSRRQPGPDAPRLSTRWWAAGREVGMEPRVALEPATARRAAAPARNRQ